MNIIQLNKLTKYYGKVKGIESLDLEVKQGEVFGFIGPNGAGKSTTIRTMLGFVKATSGDCKVLGESIHEKLHLVKQWIGYLPSETFYYDNMTAGDLLKYSSQYYKGNFDKNIEYLADYFELDLTRKIEDLSYGNRKKVGIVQALLHEPKLLILDEPTGGLDPIMQNKFFDLLMKEKEKGTTIFFSSHVLGEVQRICDRVGIIKDGALIKVETLEALSQVQYKKIRIELESTEFIKPSNMTDFERKGNMVTCLCTGNIKTFMNEVLKNDVKNMWVEDPSLEEIFLHHYQ